MRAEARVRELYIRGSSLAKPPLIPTSAHLCPKRTLIPEEIFNWSRVPTRVNAFH